MSHYCPRCGTSDEPVRLYRVRGVYEILFWLSATFFFVASIWEYAKPIAGPGYDTHFSRADAELAWNLFGIMLLASVLTSCYRRLPIRHGCPACSNPDIIPADTPIAQRATNQAQ